MRRFNDWGYRRPVAFSSVILVLCIQFGIFAVLVSLICWHGFIWQYIQTACFCMGVCYVGLMVGWHARRIHRRNMDAIWGPGRSRLNSSYDSDLKPII